MITLLEKIEEYSNNGKLLTSLMISINKNHNNWLNELKIITTFLDNTYENIPNNQRFYHIWFNEYDIERCKICDIRVKWSGGFNKNIHNRGCNYLKTCGNKKCSRKLAMIESKKTCLELYGAENAMHNADIKNKVKHTNLKKYGVENAMQNVDIKNKVKHTNLEKYGQEYFFKTNTFKVSSEQTNLEKYGAKHAMQNDKIKEKSKQTCMNKYGQEYFFRTDEFKESAKKTNLVKYGGISNMQDSTVYEKNKKSAYKHKPYILPSGKEIKIQGYENKFLDEYFSGKGLENDILIDNKDIELEIGKIWYFTEDEKKHRYYPDIYLINENKIIEVKSEYTVTCDKDVNLLKKQACLDKGLNFEFKIY